MPYIWIGGCGHSGTTLLLKLLGYHSQIESPLGMKENSTRIFTKDHLAYNKAKQAHKEKQVKYLLYKNPSNILYFRQMKRLYPKSKVILMIRDGRDVAISCHKRKLRPTFSDCVNYWKERTNMTFKYDKKPNVLVIRYEDLADHPARTLKIITDFLNLSQEDLVSIYNENLNETLSKPKSEKGLSNHNKLRKWQVNQKIERSSRWGKEMTPKQKRTFTRLAGSILHQAGYDKTAGK